MTNINCARDCIFQHDGKCCYDNITLNLVSCQQTNGTNCAYQLSSKQSKNQEKD